MAGGGMCADLMLTDWIYGCRGITRAAGAAVTGK